MHCSSYPWLSCSSFFFATGFYFGEYLFTEIKTGSEEKEKFYMHAGIISKLFATAREPS